MKAINIIVKGRVQGVNFRRYAMERAIMLGVNGFARNLDNGDVEILAEGKEEKVKEFAKICRIGPSVAEVKECVIKDVEVKGYKEFEIL